MADTKVDGERVRMSVLAATSEMRVERRTDDGSGESRTAGFPLVDVERTTGFEPATPTLARWCSTTEPRPRTPTIVDAGSEPFNRTDVLDRMDLAAC